MVVEVSGRPKATRVPVLDIATDAWLLLLKDRDPTRANVDVAALKSYTCRAGRSAVELPFAYTAIARRLPSHDSDMGVR